ncbi:MAG: transcriptional regulator [Xanthobacteraceae bacterium]|nr:transcriptional regulator [Xanthobacteraceae bacterium]
MARPNKATADRADAAAVREERLRDGKLARREYEQNQSAVLVNMQRLRALRLSRESELPPAAEPKPSGGSKRRAKT